MAGAQTSDERPHVGLERLDEDAVSTRHVAALRLGKALAVVGVPLAATAAGWLLAGREPAAISRPVID